ncbi:MAG: 3-deoxy-7-phosphoheptulonate synthase [Peptococcaceae bacterium BICA1-7]|nr:MAG: 3-deoxy-7-phosphoheptulonate synthase [Peptococcaceae bacterium BICA1-7]HBV96423.1 3-deoxy-7-phosphoheptulonate synthase [Desulfotomaculum sp.]
MIIVMEINCPEEHVDAVVRKLEQNGLQAHLIRGAKRLVIGAVGDKGSIQSLGIEGMPGVMSAVPIMKPFKLVSREARGENSVVRVGNVDIGGSQIALMAGPCAVETADQMYAAASAVKAAGAGVLRGGAFKPRTSPYSFQGLEEEGLKMMSEAAKKFGLATVTEVIDLESLDKALKYVDMVQVGARNMQNFRLLQAVGRAGLPVLLKRGLSATIEEWLMAAEYIASEGNIDIVLCERGIRTFESYTRNTLDLSAVPLVKSLSHLPVVVDPSHATGIRALVGPMSLAAVAAGADGLIVEVHPDPQRALCDGKQSLSPGEFSRVAGDLKAVAAAVGRSA